MALFSMFGAKPKEESEMIPLEVNKTQESSDNPEVSEEEKKDEEKKKLITIVWGTGLPIDVIFNYIHKNFEEDGFQDALVNSDVAYRDTRETIIKNDLMMLFSRITLRYKDDIREIDTKIDNARKALALGAASRLQARRDTYEEHLAQLSEMHQQLMAGDPKMMTMIESYRRGFSKGITAAAINFIENN